jgi:DNA-binding MarR family transcriptional regulator
MGSKQAAGRLYSGILKKTGIKPEQDFVQLERHVKGVANHWRLAMLFLIAKQKGITLDQIALALGCNIKTVSDHTRRLAHAGLIEKKYISTSVTHSLTPYGERFRQFLLTL